MKWKLWRLFLPLLVAGFVLPLLVRGPDGQPVMTLSDWAPPPAVIDGFTGLLARMSRVSDEGAAAVLEPEKIYRWQDERGMWHFSIDAADAPAHAVVEELPLVVNELPAPQILEASGGIAAGETLPEVSGMLEGAVEGAVEGAEDIRRLSEERLQTLEQL